MSEEYQRAILIYEGDKDSEPVCQIELLSPSNKPRGAGYREYLKKWRQCLASGIALIEIDYLHQTPPLLPHLPSYPKEKVPSPFEVAYQATFEHSCKYSRLRAAPDGF